MRLLGTLGQTQVSILTSDGTAIVEVTISPIHQQNSKLMISAHRVQSNGSCAIEWSLRYRMRGKILTSSSLVRLNAPLEGLLAGITTHLLEGTPPRSLVRELNGIHGLSLTQIGGDGVEV